MGCFFGNDKKNDPGQRPGEQRLLPGTKEIQKEEESISEVMCNDTITIYTMTTVC